MVGAYPATDVHDYVWPTDDHLWGPDVTGLSLNDLLDEIELGERADWWMTNCMFASVYTSERDRCRAIVSVMVGAVAEVTSRRDLPFPSEWWPPSADEPAP